MFRRTITLIGYVGALIVVAVITVALVSYGRGYTYDFASGRLIQTGLVIIQSSPSASVALNGKATKKNTPYRASFESSSYTFTLTKEGFHPWTKVLRVVASQVTNAIGVILVPLTPQTNVLDVRSQVVSQAISHDHKHLVYVTSGLDAGVYNLDIASSKALRVYSPKAATATQPAETLTSASWSEDGSHLLISVMIGANPAYRVIPAGGGDVLNLTEQYGFNFSGLTFSGYNWKQLYWISSDGLRRLDLDAQSVSGVLADKVSQFNTAGDRTLYIQTTELGRTLMSIDSRGRKQQLVQALPDSETYAIATTNYRGQDQLAVVPSRTGIATIYSGIYGQNPIARTVAHDVANVSFSPDGHLAAFSSPAGVQTYDLEMSDLKGHTVLYASPVHAGAISALTWFDNFHLLINRSGVLQWCDYDGTNSVDLGATLPVGPAYGASDARTVVVFRPDTSGVKVMGIEIKP